MSKTRVWVRFLLSTLFFFGPAYCILAFLLCANLGRADLVWPALLLFIPFLLMNLARAFVRSTPLTLVLHAALAAVPLLLFPLPPAVRGCCAAALAVLGILSAAKRLKAERARRKKQGSAALGFIDKLSAFRVTTWGVVIQCALNALLMMLSTALGSRVLTTALTLWGVLYIVCYLVIGQTARLDDALAYLDKNTSQPVAGVLRMNNALLAVLLGLAGVVIALSFLLPVDTASAAVGGVLANVMEWYRTLFPDLPAIIPPVFENMAVPPPARERSEGWMAFGTVLLGALACVGVFLLGWVLVRFLGQMLQNRPRRTSADGDERENMFPPPKKKMAESQPRAFGREKPSFGRGPQAKIRKAYYRAVRRQMKKGAKITQAQTVGEIERTVAEKEKIQELGKLYNVARYGKASNPAAL